MSELRFVHLHEVSEENILALMNNKEVGLQMPLLPEKFSREQCRSFVQTKKELWERHGYGPWAFLVDGEFAGWGGLQPEQGEVDFALVLDPEYWGWGYKIFREVCDRAFNQMNFDSITILFPPTRINFKAVMRFGFIEDGQITIEGEIFKRFRLVKSLHNSNR